MGMRGVTRGQRLKHGDALDRHRRIDLAARGVIFQRKEANRHRDIKHARMQRMHAQIVFKPRRQSDNAPRRIQRAPRFLQAHPARPERDAAFAQFKARLFDRFERDRRFNAARRLARRKAELRFKMRRPGFTGRALAFDLDAVSASAARRQNHLHEPRRIAGETHRREKTDFRHIKRALQARRARRRNAGVKISRAG